MMWGYGWSGMGFLWMILAGVFWLAVLGALIWALVRWSGARGQRPATTPTQNNGQSALEILRQRFARGEIDATTFEQMREHHEGSAGVSDEPRTPTAPTAL